MAVVLTLGVLVLQGCVSVKFSSDKREIVHTLTNARLCQMATTIDGNWDSSSMYRFHVKEAKRRGLNCGVKDKKTISASNQNQVKNKTCTPELATNLKIPNKFRWNNCEGILKISKGSFKGYEYIGEFKNGLPEGNGKEIAPTGDKYNGQFKKGLRHGHGTYFFKNGEKYIGEFKLGKINGHGTSYYKNGNKYVGEHKNSKANGKGILYVQNGKNLEGVWKNDTLLYEKEIITKNNKFALSAKENLAEKQKRLELERELAELKKKQKQEQQRINTDTEKPIINAFSKLDGSMAIISARVTDDMEVAEVFIDNEQLSLTKNGTFKTKLYIPRNGLNVEIVAFDKKGNKASKLLKIERDNIQQASGPKFDTLNPSGKRVSANPNALALIIGVANYEKTSANALYADKDAQQFYDYATMKLGISPFNIKELVNNKADRVEIALAVKDWISRSTKQNKTDIYLFFAGHGLATADGKDMFLLPYDGLPRLLQDSAIKRDQLFADIQKANPKSVTVFLDTCYSGTTRGTDMLIASRPIAIRALEQSIPSNFTLFSAAAGDQTSKPLEEAKHGMFSYFLMKGMEGDADTNSDNKITARELHAYIEQNIVQQSSGSQTPELQGDKDRVIVKFK